MGDFRLEQPDDGLGQGVVVGVPNTADGGFCSGRREPFRLLSAVIQQSPIGGS